MLTNPTITTEGGQDDDEAQEIPLPNVKAQTLARVIEFCQHYKTERMNEIEKVSLDVFVYPIVLYFYSILTVFCSLLSLRI